MKESNRPLSRALIAISLAASLLLAACSSPEEKAENHLKKANDFYASGDFASAEIEYINVLRSDGENMEAIGQLGMLYNNQGLQRKAFALLQAAHEADPENDEVQLSIASTLMSAGDLDSATESAREVLQRSPGNTLAPLILADCVRTEDRVPQVEAMLAEAQTNAPQNPAIYVARASIELKKNNREAASGLIDQALAADPSFAAAHAARGALYLIDDKQEEAKASFKAAADSSTPRSQQAIRYARFLIQAGESEAAIAFLEAEVESGPGYVPALNLLAETLATAERFEEAEKATNEVLKQDPHQGEANMTKAKIALAQNDLEKAVRILENLIGLYPRSVEGIFLLARAQLAQGELPKAMANLDKAISIKPDFADATLVLANVFMQQGDHREAALRLERLLNKLPQHVPTLLLLAQAHQAYGDLDSAVQVYDTLAERYPDNAAVPLYRGQIHARAGDADKARAEFKRSLELQPNNYQTIEQLFLLDANLENYAAAQATLDAGRKEFPESAQLEVLQGRLLLAQSKADEAKETFEKAITFDPDNRSPYLYLAQAYIQNDEAALAIERLNTVIEKNDSDVGALMLRGVLLDQQGDTDAAIESYESLLAAAPDFSPALNNLAYLYSEKKGDLDKGLELAERARELLPRDPYTADTLGWIVFQKGDYTWAASLIGESVQQLGDNPEVHYHYGMTQYMRGFADAARESFEIALNSDATFNGKDICRQHFDILNIDPDAPSSADQQLLKNALAGKKDPIAMMKQAQISSNAGDTEKAVELWNGALEISPQNAIARASLATELLQQGKTDEALQHAKDAYKQAPNQAVVSLALAKTNLQAGDFEWAYSLLREAEKSDDRLGFETAYAAYARGQIEASHQTLSTAPASANKSLLSTLLAAHSSEIQIDDAKVDDTEQPLALIANFRVLKKGGNKQSAADALEDLARKYPNFLPAKREQAILAAETQDLEKLKTLLPILNRHFPDDPETAFARGVSALQSGNADTAKMELAKAAQSNRVGKQSKEMLESM